jgi:hypothetical protein
MGGKSLRRGRDRLDEFADLLVIDPRSRAGLIRGGQWRQRVDPVGGRGRSGWTRRVRACWTCALQPSRRAPIGSSFSGLVDESDKRTLENWQSEFLAVGSMAIFAVYLRQRGSPESKPVGAPHHSTGIEG